MGIKRNLLAAVALTAALAGGAAAPAFAGEVDGNGRPITINARSECAYSGLEDGDGNPPGPGYTQNWGQIPKADRDFLRSIGVAPETLCNGHLNPIK